MAPQRKRGLFYLFIFLFYYILKIQDTAMKNKPAAVLLLG